MEDYEDLAYTPRLKRSSSSRLPLDVTDLDVNPIGHPRYLYKPRVRAVDDNQLIHTRSRGRSPVLCTPSKSIQSKQDVGFYLFERA